MPFTFAHPLFIWPIKYLKPKYISLTGLILGSMSPDFEYFIALEPYQTIGHTHMGLLLQALPLSVILLLLLQVVMRPFSLHLPSVFDLDMKSIQLIRYFNYRSVMSWMVFLVSVVAGFYSHIFIDAFTHQSGYFVQQFSILQSSFVGLPLYKWLQYSLGLVGLGVQFVVIVWIYSKTESATRSTLVTSKQKLTYWLLVAIIAVGVVVAKLTFTASSNMIGILIVSSISGVIVGIIIASLLYRHHR